MRRTYRQFARLVERARREVLREGIGDPSIHVIAMSFEAPFAHEPNWGEFYHPHGPIVIYQDPYEIMPERELYYPQIKAVLRHEYGHAAGESHGEDFHPEKVGTAPLPSGWLGPDPVTVAVDKVLVTIP